MAVDGKWMATLAETRKETSGDAFFFYFEGPIVALFFDLLHKIVRFAFLNNKTIRQVQTTDNKGQRFFVIEKIYLVFRDLL